MRQTFYYVFLRPLIFTEVLVLVLYLAHLMGWVPRILSESSGFPIIFCAIGMMLWVQTLSIPRRFWWVMLAGVPLCTYWYLLFVVVDDARVMTSYFGATLFTLLFWLLSSFWIGLVLFLMSCIYGKEILIWNEERWREMSSEEERIETSGATFANQAQPTLPERHG